MNERPSIDERHGRGRPWSGEEGARRLHDRVRAACVGEDDLPARLEVGLRTAFGSLAADPGLARLLTVEPYLGSGDAESLDAHRRWIDRFGELLRDAAAEDPRASQRPSFLAPFLIGGVRLRIARVVLNGEGPDLLRLLPGTLEGLLAYYFEPGEPRVLARAALAAQRRAGDELR